MFFYRGVIVSLIYDSQAEVSKFKILLPCIAVVPPEKGLSRISAYRYEVIVLQNKVRSIKIISINSINSMKRITTIAHVGVVLSKPDILNKMKKNFL